MALVKCSRCGEDVSTYDAACKKCGKLITESVSKSKERMPDESGGSPFFHQKGQWIIAGIILLVGVPLVFYFSGGDSSESAARPKRAFNWNDALYMCQMAIASTARDPETADVPYVPNAGSTGIYRYLWGVGTKFVRMRNGLGIEVPVSASCAVGAESRRIVELIVDGVRLI